MKNKKLYIIWCAIKARCYNSNCPSYKYYGQRGIKMYTPWLTDFYSFESYVKSFKDYDKNNLGKKGITLDRINNNDDYKPGNLRWSTMLLQSRNRRKKTGSHSKYIGVSEDKSGIRIKKWSARITINKKTIRIGRYTTQEEAKKARDQYIVDHKLENFMLNN